MVRDMGRFGRRGTSVISLPQAQPKVSEVVRPDSQPSTRRRQQAIVRTLVGCDREREAALQAIATFRRSHPDAPSMADRLAEAVTQAGVCVKGGIRASHQFVSYRWPVCQRASGRPLRGLGDVWPGPGSSRPRVAAADSIRFPDPPLVAAARRRRPHHRRGPWWRRRAHDERHCVDQGSVAFLPKEVEG